MATTHRIPTPPCGAWLGVTDMAGLAAGRRRRVGDVLSMDRQRRPRLCRRMNAWTATFDT